MVDSSLTSHRTTKRRFDSLSCCCDADGDGDGEDDDEDEEGEDDEDEEKNDDDDEENTSLRIAALAAARSECRVVARIGMNERDVRRRRWQVRAWPMPLLEGQTKIQGVEHEGIVATGPVDSYSLRYLRVSIHLL